MEHGMKDGAGPLSVDHNTFVHPKVRHPGIFAANLGPKLGTKIHRKSVFEIQSGSKKIGAVSIDKEMGLRKAACRRNKTIYLCHFSLTKEQNPRGRERERGEGGGPRVGEKEGMGG